ncbi:hypothetical protein AQF98_00990 [Pedobacter sp. Hv1]|nr:hypothetical protein AQF98_00990 [Pedobacter sp. Hv1]
MKNKLLPNCLFGLILLLSSLHGSSQQTLKNKYWDVQINENGELKSLAQFDQQTWLKIPVQEQNHKGFSFYYVENNGNIKKGKPIILIHKSNNIYEGKINEVMLSLKYELRGDNLVVTATAENKGNLPFAPQTLGLKMGVSNYMVNYPQWNSIYFPTMLRCEKTHFTGYLQTPEGNTLAVASPNAIASYSLDYNSGGHRIYTFNLDLINTEPLPKRHAKELSSLAPGEKKNWTIYLKKTNINNLAKTLYTLTNAPSFDIPVTALTEGEDFKFTIYGNKLNLSVQTPDGKTLPVVFKNIAENKYAVKYVANHGPGVYTFEAKNTSGKITQAKISVLKPMSWYMKQARLAVLKDTQKASWNCENWYGLYTSYLAEQYFPDAALNRAANERFNIVMPLMYDTAHNWKPIKNASRIQNHTTTIGILVDKYLAEKNIKDLETARYLTDWIIQNAQTPDGAYRNGKIHYTSVIYIAKSIMELMEVEKTLSHDNNEWAKAYERHYNSVKRAIDQLTLGFAGIDTEGELTFEDGMISCSALQIAQFALLQKDEKAKNFYIQKAKTYLDAHECLQQLFINDSRMRSGTMRFWEAQYDVLIGANLMSSPHGWSAWATYANYYLYLLTGEEKYLVRTINALGSGMQLVDFKTGELNWAFAADPYINSIQAEDYPGTGPNIYHNNQFSPYAIKNKPIVVGEQYIPMIAEKFNANSSDNDVHEQFKCMEEVALTSAYIMERKDGSLINYNCKVSRKGNTLTIEPNEKIISKIHFNLTKNTEVKVLWAGNKTKVDKVSKGMSWLKR